MRVSSTDLPSVYINGRPVNSLSVFDRGCQYGDGLFETIAVKDGIACLLDRHLKRLSHGLKILSFPPFDLDQLKSDVLDFSPSYPNAALKIMITRGNSDRGYLSPETVKMNTVLSFSNYSVFSDIRSLTGINICCCQTPVSVNPLLAGLKHLNRLDNVLARNEWDHRLFDEGLMFDSQGLLIEATAANVFLIKNKKLFTPQLTQAGVLGVIRELVLESAEKLSIETSITQLSREDCYQADAVFLTNSLVGIKPVKRLEQYQYNEKHWPLSLFDEVMSHVYS